MKKAISIWSFAEQDLKKCIDLAKDAGFSGIELALGAEGQLSLQSTAAELAELRQYADGQGVTIHSLACNLCWENSFADDDVQERERAYEIAVKQIETAKALGASAVLMVPGSVQSILRPGKATIPYDVAYQRNLDMFLRLKEVAEQHEIHIGIENVWNKIFLSPLELRDFIDKIGSKFVGAYFDVGNVLATGFPEQWIRILGSRIKKVHFKDYRSNTTGFDGFVDLLSGEVNWKAVTEAFAEIGYNGWYTAEMIPPYAHFPEQILYNTSASMDKILG